MWIAISKILNKCKKYTYYLFFSILPEMTGWHLSGICQFSHNLGKNKDRNSIFRKLEIAKSKNKLP